MLVRALLIVLIGSFIISPLASQTTVGGFVSGDSLSKIFSIMGNPDRITSSRGDAEEEDSADIWYISPQITVFGLYPDGNRLRRIVTWSPSMQTNDGLKVGSSRSDVVSKRGLPENVSQRDDVTILWYWAQGLAFSVNTGGAVDTLFLFEPVDRSERAGVRADPQSKPKPAADSVSGY